MPLTAVAPDQSILAVYNDAQTSSSRILIKCYDGKVSLGSLKFTLSANNKDSVHTLNKLVFASSQFLVASTEEGSILVFDLNRGVLSQTIETSDVYGKVVSIAAEDDTLYSLSFKDGKTVVLVYDLTRNAKIIKKVKTGSCDEDEPIAIDVSKGDGEAAHIAIRLGRKLKVVNANDGSVVTKAKMKGSDSDSGDKPFIKVSDDSKFIVANTASNLHYFSIDDGNNCSSCGTSAIGNIVDAKINSNDSTYTIAATDNATLSLVNVKAASSKKSVSKAFAFVAKPEMSDNVTMDGYFSKGDIVMTEIITKGLQNMDVEMARLSVENASGNLYPVEDDQPSDEDQPVSKKRKISTKSVVLGPGESGGEALTVVDSTKRAKRDSDDESNSDQDDFELENIDDEEGEGTIAERLALLSSELDRDDDDDEDLLKYQRSAAAEGFKIKAATSDSLVILLRQALTSNDDTQLEVALQVSDKKVIENSIMALSAADEEGNDEDGPQKDGEMIIALLTKLVTRLSRKPSRAQQLAFWIRTVLVAIISASNNGTLKMGEAERDIASRLAPLRSMLNERVESLPALLRLEGRLSLLGKPF